MASNHTTHETPKDHSLYWEVMEELAAMRDAASTDAKRGNEITQAMQTMSRHIFDDGKPFPKAVHTILDHALTIGLDEVVDRINKLTSELVKTRNKIRATHPLTGGVVNANRTHVEAIARERNASWQIAADEATKGLDHPTPLEAIDPSSIKALLREVTIAKAAERAERQAQEGARSRISAQDDRQWYRG